MLYTFDNLYVGMHLPINTGYTDITVFEIDSVLIGDTYRKSYLMDNPHLAGFDRWIEGIGSDKDLLSPFLEEYENAYYTLCYEDTVLYHIGATQGFTNCYYSSYLSIPETITSGISIYPNPACNTICFQGSKTYFPAEIAFYDSQGVVRKRLNGIVQNQCIDISGFINGVYIITINSGEGFHLNKFVKK